MHDRLDISMRANHLFFMALVAASLCFGIAAAVLGGLLSLGQALYFGVGAYTSALVLREEPSFWLALSIATAVTLVAGVVGGLIANRVRGVYFAPITFGMAQVVAKVIYNTQELGASDGLIGVPILQIPLGPVTLSADNPLGFFCLTFVVIGLLYAGVAYLLTKIGRASCRERV